MAAYRGIYWLTPVAMFGGLLAGTCFAVGHHLFYSGLDGQPVSGGAFLNSPVSKQQANIAIGTALAFLVKASLIFAVGIAFTQIFWANNHALDPNQPGTLDRLDSSYGAMDKFWVLLNIFIWWSSPLLISVATIAWLLPIVAIIKPATLSIQSSAVIQSSLMDVPNTDFRSLSYVALMGAVPGGVNTCFDYEEPNDSVKKVVNAVMAQGEILPFDPPASNASWTVEFPAPSLKCEHIEGKLSETIKSNIRDAEKYASHYYASWFPNSHGSPHNNQSSGLPFYTAPPQDFGGSLGTSLFSEGSLVPDNNVDMEFYVAAIPGTTRSFPTHAYGTTTIHLNNFTMVHCRLQKMATKIKDIEAAETMQTVRRMCFRKDLEGDQDGFYCSPEDRSCVYIPYVFQSLSYQAIMDAFTQQISGLISLEVNAGKLNITTNILSTVLGETYDLMNIRPEKQRSSQAWQFSLPGTIQDQIWFHTPQFRGLVNGDDDKVTLNLPLSLENLFENATISMLSSSALQ